MAANSTMHDHNDFNKVLIIGAGLGGLALAQILHHHRVPFEIFERDEDPSVRKQGWAVALIESVHPPGSQEIDLESD